MKNNIIPFKDFINSTVSKFITEIDYEKPFVAAVAVHAISELKMCVNIVYYEAPTSELFFNAESYDKFYVVHKILSDIKATREKWGFIYAEN